MAVKVSQIKSNEEREKAINQKASLTPEQTKKIAEEVAVLAP